MPGSRDKAVNKTHIVPVLIELTLYWELTELPRFKCAFGDR